MTGADAKSLHAVSNAAARLRIALENLLDKSPKPTGAMALRLLMQNTPHPPILEYRWQMGERRRIKFLRSEVVALETTAIKAAALGTPNSPHSTVLTHLLNDDLPALFERHMGRPCGNADGSNRGRKASEGARFLAAAHEHLGLGEMKPSAVVRRRKRQRQSVKGDKTAAD